MGFLIQYSCAKCGFKSPDDDNALIDTLGISDLNICSCNKCHSLFHRKRDSNHKLINACPKCGNEKISIYDNLNFIPCPQCDNDLLELELIGFSFN